MNSEYQTLPPIQTLINEACFLEKHETFFFNDEKIKTVGHISRQTWEH